MKKVLFLDKLKQNLSTLAVTAMMMLLGTQTAFASTTYIKSLSVRVNVTLEAGESLPSVDEEDVTISSGTRYNIDSVEWSKMVKDVELGGTYNMKITLSPLGEYEFKSSYSSSTVTVKGGTFVSAKRNSSGDLVITVKSKPAKGNLEEPDNVEWVTDVFKNAKFGYAKWDKVENAKYDVTLYRNDKMVHKVTALTATTYNFYPYMTKEGDYTFRVRAVPMDSDVDNYADNSDWEYSGTLCIAADEVSDGSGQENANGEIITDEVGWIQSGDKWYFRYPDGTYLKDSWGKINEIWYLFDSTGQMLTGWQKANDVWYYMNANGAMKTGWVFVDDIWYYLNNDGSMATGWVTVNDKTYYMTESGAMATGWKEVNGEFYYFYPDGHKAINEVISGFYVDYNGIWHRP